MDYPLPFHENASQAALVANCAGMQEKYWEIRELIFNGQSDLSLETNIARALSLGIDETRFMECLASETMINQINDDLATGIEIGITGTPSFLISNNFDISNLSAFEVKGSIIYLNQLSESIAELIGD
jgi:protein-disulfide isomerase